MTSRRSTLSFGLMLAALSLSAGQAAQDEAAAPSAAAPPQKPGKADRCPVCGMFVAPYAEWVASVRFQDEATVYFDGAKDLFKFLADVPRFAHGRSAQSIAAIFVTDYYDVEAIDAHTAYFVLGSDVRGPMGAELIPHRDQAAAEEFMADHLGTKILRFGAVDAALLAALDR